MIFLRRGLVVNNLGLALGVVLTFYSSVTKGWKLKVIRFWWPSLDWRSYRERSGRGPAILNRVF